MTPEALGWRGFFAEQFAAHAADGLVPGRIVAEHRGRFIAATECGEMPAHPVGRARYQADSRADLPVVGDWVAVRVLPEAPPRAVIHAVLRRQSLFSRRAAGTRDSEQPIAANVDTVFLVTGLDGNFNPRRIERYLTMAWESGAQPVVLLSKADLCDQVEERLAAVRAVAAGAEVHAISVMAAGGLDALDRYLQPARTLALLGSSGVGKSTLLNYLLGQERQRVEAVREDDSRGRHTTTHRQLFVLPSGALIMDTPGMRELQLWHAEEGLGETFADIEALARECRFSDCTHRYEPGCRVREALQEGTLDRARFNNYRKMQGEMAYLATRNDISAAAAEKRKWKQIHKAARKLGKPRPE